MKLVNPKFEELNNDNPLLLGEECTRVCYKSENLIKEGSAKKLLTGIINSGHVAMIEHIPLYLEIGSEIDELNYDNSNGFYKTMFSPYSKRESYNGKWYVSSNLRVLFESDPELCEEFMSHDGNMFTFKCGYVRCCKFDEFPKMFHRRVTIKFTMDRIGSQSFCRHRVFSFAQESTRWCNYLKEKFGSELSIITPCWLKDEDKSEFIHDMEEIEKYYFKWVNKGYKAEDARAFMPFGVKTEIIMTGFIDAWNHFFELRVDSHAHEQARELAIPLQEYFKENGYIK